MYRVLCFRFTALDILGFSVADFQELIKHVPGVPGRLERVTEGQDFQVLVDYAHTPDAMETVLQTLSEAYPASNLISVFGCGGDRDKAKRPIMGEIATRLSSEAIITDDNPRSERPMDIINAIVTGCGDRQNFTIIQDRSSAVNAALEDAEKGDVIAVLGKGHEPYQEIMGERIAYSDMSIINQFMEQHGYSA